MSVQETGEKTPDVSRARPAGGFLGPLRAVALLAAVAGAVGSVALMLHAGRHNPSRFLIALFVIWVLGPFVFLLLADAFSKSWPVPTRATLHAVTLVVALGSLALYSHLSWRPSGTKPAAVFLMVPLASEVLMAIAIPAAQWMSRRRAPRGSTKG